MKRIEIENTEYLNNYFAENLFEIPDYQRAYAWKPDDLDTLFDDILNSKKENKEHFFGIIITLKDSATLKASIIDGQQRVTTSILILLAIKHLLKEKGLTDRNNEAIHSIYGKINDILEQPVRWNGERFKYRLKTNTQNLELFEKIYDSENSGQIKEYYEDLDNISESNKNLYKTYTNFINKINDKINEDLSEDSEEEVKKEAILEFIEGFLDQFLRHFKILEISVGDLSFAYEFFQSINNKGVNLSAFDIIKAKMFEICSDNELNTERINKYFNTIQGNLGSIDSNKFLRHFWMSKYERMTINKLLDEILEKYDTSNKALSLFEELATYSSIYADICNKSTSYDNVNEALKDILVLSKDFVLPVLLSAYVNLKNERSMVFTKAI